MATSTGELVTAPPPVAHGRSRNAADGSAKYVFILPAMVYLLLLGIFLSNGFFILGNKLKYLAT